MSLTKEMIHSIDSEVEFHCNEDLLTYHSSYKFLNAQFPNSFYEYRVQKSFQEILKRGIEGELYDNQYR